MNAFKQNLLVLLLLALPTELVFAAGSPYVPMYPDGSVPNALKLTNQNNIFKGTGSGTFSGTFSGNSFGTFTGTFNGNAVGLTNYPFFSLTYPTYQTNQIVLVGLTTGDIGNGGNGDISYLNGTYNWSGTAYVKGTNGVYYAPDWAGVGPHWMATNALHHDIVSPNVVIVLGNVTSNVFGFDDGTIFIPYVTQPYDGITGNSVPAGSGGYALTGTSTNATDSVVFPWAPLVPNSYDTNLFPTTGPNNLDWFGSNYLMRYPARPLDINPIAIADAKGGITYLVFGDSTTEYAESPPNKLNLKLLQRYGFGGWIAGPGAPGSGNIPVSLLTNVFAPAGLGLHNGNQGIWTIDSGTNGIAYINGQNTPSSYLGQSYYIMTNGSFVFWTNSMIMGVPTPHGGVPGATSAAVWYAVTNSDGGFQLQASTNGGPFGVVANISCFAPPNRTLETTNYVVRFTNAPTTNDYTIKVVCTNGIIHLIQAGVWNDFGGDRYFKLSQGGWQLQRWWHPEYSGTGFTTPVLPTWMTNSHRNMFSPLPPDLCVINNVNTGFDQVGGTLPPDYNTRPDYIDSGVLTFNNFTAENLDFVNTLIALNPNVVNVFSVEFPVAPGTGGSYDFWPQVVGKMIHDNWDGHEAFVYADGMSGERFAKLFGSQFPHWTHDGGAYVANLIMSALQSFGPKTGLAADGHAFTPLMGPRVVTTANPPTAAALGTNGWQIWASPTNAIWIYQSPDGVTLNTKIIANF